MIQFKKKTPLEKQIAALERKKYGLVKKSVSMSRSKKQARSIDHAHQLYVIAQEVQALTDSIHALKELNNMVSVKRLYDESTADDR